jgi:hypothetical protein
MYCRSMKETERTDQNEIWHKFARWHFEGLNTSNFSPDSATTKRLHCAAHSKE